MIVLAHISLHTSLCISAAYSPRRIAELKDMHTFILLVDTAKMPFKRCYQFIYSPVKWKNVLVIKPSMTPVSF